MTQNEFIEKANLKHGNKYNYDKVKYTNGKNKVCIECPKHGLFYQKPEGHLSGNGCNKCAIAKRSKGLSLDNLSFIEKQYQFTENNMTIHWLHT